MNHNPITVQDYHQRSKHQLDGYARGPQTLDWDAQPDPFRHFAGCNKLALPLPAVDNSIPYQALYEPGTIPPAPLDLQHLGLLMELSMGLSAWKSFGPDRWALRINPSSGNLHPTECYLVLPQADDIATGVYHYHSYAHELEQRCTLTTELPLPAASFVIGLSSIHKRESWKYGERAFRYCQHDVGHALAAIRYACALLGWQCRLLDECSDAQISQLLGLNRDEDFTRAEREAPDLLLQISAGEHTAPIKIDTLLETVADANWNGQANRLTDDNFYKWPVIAQAEHACLKPVTSATSKTIPAATSPLPPCDEQLLAATIIRQRRSAQAFDDNAPPLALAHFERILQCLMPRTDMPPLDCLPWSPLAHLVLFIHRVDGLQPGLYVLPRSPAGEQLLRQQLRSEFSWESVDTLQTDLPLYLLQAANSANAARALACHQPIASDSAFSLAMLAEFDAVIDETPWRYRQLFWEAGVLGQILYLEAEAAGVRGTGIGCYFDDAVHELLGLQDTTLQDLYHFTVGSPRIDNRLQNEPPYAHLG